MHDLAMIAYKCLRDFSASRTGILSHCFEKTHASLPNCCADCLCCRRLSEQCPPRPPSDSLSDFYYSAALRLFLFLPAMQKGEVATERFIRRAMQYRYHFAPFIGLNSLQNPSPPEAARSETFMFCARSASQASSHHSKYSKACGQEAHQRQRLRARLVLL